MVKKETNFEKSRRRAEASLRITNSKIEELGEQSSQLHDTLCAIQNAFDKIKNVPNEQLLEYQKIKEVRLEWKQQAEKIERNYNTSQARAAGKGVAGAGAGVAVVALGPTAAMGIATTFGVASTGIAISTLSGAAATNAALAWLGGGALAAGGGGMAAGEALLTFTGPLGWVIAGIALLGSGALLFKNRSEEKRIERIFEVINERDTKSYELAIVELEERIKRIGNEQLKLEKVVKRVLSFGLDYTTMSEEQQYELGSYVNLMNASTQLLVNPILGLQPKYVEADLIDCIERGRIKVEDRMKGLIIQLCNLLYRIELDDNDRKALRKALSRNKEFMAHFGLKKADFNDSTMAVVKEALEDKYLNLS